MFPFTFVKKNRVVCMVVRCVLYCTISVTYSKSQSQRYSFKTRKINNYLSESDIVRKRRWPSIRGRGPEGAIEHRH